MFREMRRLKQEVSSEVCEELLKTEKRGVLSVIGDEGYPYGVPINFYYDAEEKKLYFHCAAQGHKMDALNRCEKVCFTVWNTGFQKEGDWAWNVTSVIVMGRAEPVRDPDTALGKIRRIALKYYPNAAEAEEMVQKSGRKAQIIAVRIEHMTGKLVQEK